MPSRRLSCVSWTQLSHSWTQNMGCGTRQGDHVQADSAVVNYALVMWCYYNGITHWLEENWLINPAPFSEQPKENKKQKVKVNSCHGLQFQFPF